MILKPSWIVDKKSHFDEPWCLSVRDLYGEKLFTEVVKNWQNDTTKQYARFMVKGWMGTRVESDGWDGGDEYCSNVYSGELVEVLGRVPTRDELNEWASLRQRAVPSGW